MSQALSPGSTPEPPDREPANAPSRQRRWDWIGGVASHLKSVLRDAGGARSEAASRLEIDRTTLYRLMKKFGLDPD